MRARIKLPWAQRCTIYEGQDTGQTSKLEDETVAVTKICNFPTRNFSSYHIFFYKSLFEAVAFNFIFHF